MLRDHSRGIAAFLEGLVVIVVNDGEDAGMQSVMLEYSVRRSHISRDIRI